MLPFAVRVVAASSLKSEENIILLTNCEQLEYSLVKYSTTTKNLRCAPIGGGGGMARRKYERVIDDKTHQVN